MSSKEVIVSICDYAKEFIREYQNPKLDQKVIDAIVVDFINYFALMHCGIILEFNTFELRTEKKRCEEEILQKEIIRLALEYRKKQYDKYGIIKSVNKNINMNECGGKAEANNAEAVKLIDEFINGYTMDA